MFSSSNVDLYRCPVGFFIPHHSDFCTDFISAPVSSLWRGRSGPFKLVQSSRWEWHKPDPLHCPPPAVNSVFNVSSYGVCLLIHQVSLLLVEKSALSHSSEFKQGKYPKDSFRRISYCITLNWWILGFKGSVPVRHRVASINHATFFEAWSIAFLLLSIFYIPVTSLLQLAQVLWACILVERILVLRDTVSAMTAITQRSTAQKSVLFHCGNARIKLAHPISFLEESLPKVQRVQRLTSPLECSGI